MKVENPIFDEDSGLDCGNCPFADETGTVRDCFTLGAKFDKVVFRCGANCPTAETYAEACKLAEKAES